MSPRRRYNNVAIKLLAIISISLLTVDCILKVPADHVTQSPEATEYLEESHHLKITSNSDTTEYNSNPSNHGRNSESILDPILSSNDNHVNTNYNGLKNEEVEYHPSKENSVDREYYLKAERDHDGHQQDEMQKWHSNSLEPSLKEDKTINRRHVWTEQEHHYDSADANNWWSGGGRTRHRRAKDDSMCELEIKCKGDLEQKRTGGGVTQSSGGTVRLPIRGQRGSSGDKGEKGEPGRPGVAFVGDNNVQRETRPKIAFFVGLAKNLGPLTKNRDVIFDRVVTNVGGGYDEATGAFVAPVDGTFQFNVIVSAQGKQKAAVMILQNGKMINTVWAESVPSWSTSSSTLILTLKVHDRVNLLALQQASYLHGYMYTSFSGHLLFED